VQERDDLDFALEDHIAGEVGERVRSIISAAESAAGALRHEAEQQIQARKRLAETERARYLETARKEADDLLRQRVSRMSELSDELIEGAAHLLGEIEGAGELRSALDRTVAALAESAEELLAETRRAPRAQAAAPPPAQAPPQAVPTEPDLDPEATGPEPEPMPVRVVPQDPADADEPVDAEVVDDAEPEPADSARPLRPAPDPEAANGTVDEDVPRTVDDDALAARLVALQMAVAGSSRGEVEEHLRVHFQLNDTTAILNDVFGSDVPGVVR
jgi:hypothetical protein